MPPKSSIIIPILQLRILRHRDAHMGIISGPVHFAGAGGLQSLHSLPLCRATWIPGTPEARPVCFLLEAEEEAFVRSA